MAIDVTADPRLVTDKEATADYLAPILNIPKEQIVASLTTDKHFAYVAKQVTPRFGTRSHRWICGGFSGNAPPSATTPLGNWRPT